MEYRCIGDVAGGWPQTGEDVLLAIEHVRELASRYPIDLDRVVLVGHSAGGQLALWSSFRTRIALRGVLSIAGVVDMHLLAELGHDHRLIARLLGGEPAEVADRWADASPSRHLPWPTRVVLVCGTDDVHWEPNVATANAASLEGSDVELLPLPGAGHFEPIDPVTPEWALVRTRLQELFA